MERKRSIITCDVLAIVPFTEINRLGVCAEVCMNYSLKGKSVAFSHLKNKRDNFSIDPLLQNLGANRNHIVNNLGRYLNKFGVEILTSSDLTAKVKYIIFNYKIIIFLSLL